MKSTKTRLTGWVVALVVALVGAWEGLRTTAYHDIIGKPTICYGETKGVKMGDTATKAQCDTMLIKSLKRHEAGMRKCLNNPDKIPIRTYVAFVSLTYNIGVGNFCRSTARSRLNAGDWAGACKAATWFNRAGGRKVQGLVNRRQDEYKLCMQGAKG
ncbi:lysozyme [Pseudovibrio ascidiaceicola]|uniref:Lysozyme n=1 Tax=Pseudovibrio ascidiaceicola TaxID=285279 RepID=A0A1I4E381_9HYPH|nr:lysozyme [Pseudovibrio ascidiaceicola]SFK99037.1 lysozyme [Pseudovibrio ascidiaceicola]